MKTILAPVDFSDFTKAVVAATVELAHAMRARIVLFNAVQPPAVLSEYAGLIDNIADIMAAGERAAQRRLDALVDEIHRRSLAAEAAWEVGSPVPLIIRQASKCSADYIVLCSHGHTALYDLLVGSTAHGVLARATCPVIVVPSTKRPVRAWRV